MLPSLVVEEVRRGVAETLRAQFESSTELAIVLDLNSSE